MPARTPSHIERPPQESQDTRSEAVRIWLLDGFRVSVGSRTIERGAWRLKRAAALVKLLALAPSHRMHREQAMETLWPDSGRSAASNSLRTTLHAARHVLEPPMGSHYLASEDESLVLCPGGDVWVDVDAFEEATASARRSQDPAAYRAALELYRGELLPEDRYEDWAGGRRQQLRHTWLSLHVGLARLYEERGEYEKGIEALQRVVLEEPANEELHAGLMRLYAFSERQGEAIAQYERLREALSGQLEAEVGTATQRLREDIAAGRFPPVEPTVPPTEEPSDTSKHNLPPSRTSFVGREHEMKETKRDLAMTRLLTLMGTGGSGKTRLALEVARDLVGAYPEGVWLVELAGLSEDDLIPQAVAAALGVQEQPGQPLTNTLTVFLREKNMLLILDNCEHLLDAAARLTEILLDSCPHLTVLATSREVLNIAREINRPVPVLSVPDVADRVTVEELERYESARLFADRALFVERTLYGSYGFALGPDNARAVAEICSRLEGIPLAIELAAAWVGTLSVEQISERLKDSLRFLKSGSREIAPRQRTLRGAMNWSYDLLSESEQLLFRRLSVLAGGWTLEAAEALGAGEGVEEEEVLELLWGLVNKSLVVAEAGKQRVAARYQMLEPIRQYAREKLNENGEAEQVQNRHAAFFLALAERAEPELTGRRLSVWVERLEDEHDNLREALSWVLERGESELALRLGAALWRFWNVRGYLHEGTKSLERVLADSDPAASPVRVKALEGMGLLTQVEGDHERARATYDEMLELSRELDDKGNIATALNSLGTVAAQLGDNERARALLNENLEVIGELEAERDPAAMLKKFYVVNLLGYLAIYAEGDYARGTTLWEESLALAKEAGDTYLVGNTLSNLGHPALMQRDYGRAKARSEEALQVAQELGGVSVGFAGSTFINLGLAALGLGEQERATRAFQAALLLSQDSGAKPQIIEALEGMASICGVLGENARAAHLWGAAEAAREFIGIALSSGERALHEPYLTSVRSRLGETAWEAALAEGRAMSLEEAAEDALSEEADQPEATLGQTLSAHDGSMGDLTPREWELALLVARGFTNRQISTELSLSERTAGNHVAKILKKLGLNSRVQIATWASERQPPGSRLD